MLLGNHDCFKLTPPPPKKTKLNKTKQSKTKYYGILTRLTCVTKSKVAPTRQTKLILTKRDRSRKCDIMGILYRDRKLYQEESGIRRLVVK